MGDPVSVEDATPHPADGPRRSLARNALALLGSQLFTWMIAFVIAAIQPRYLGPVGQGQLRLAGSIWSIVSVFAIAGTSTLLTVEIAKRRSTADDLLRKVIRLRFALLICLAPSVALLLFIADYPMATTGVVAVAGASTLLSLAGSAYDSGMYGLEEMGVAAKVAIVGRLVSAVALIAVLLLGAQAIGVSLLNVVLSAFLLLLGVWFWRRVPRPPAEPSNLVGRRLARAGLPFLVAEAGLIVYTQIDTITMSLLLSEKEIGWYATADQLYGTALFIPSTLMVVLLPALANAQERDPGQARAMLHRALRTLVLFAFPVGAGTVIISQPFVDLVYGDQFTEAGPVLAVLGVVITIGFFNILLGRYAMATGRPAFWNVLMVIGIVLTIPLDIVLVPWADRAFSNGAIGGALSYVITETVMVVAGMLRLARQAIDRSFVRRVLTCGIAAVLMFAVGWPLRGLVFVIPGAAALAVYLLVIIVTRTIDDFERDAIRQLRARLLRRNAPTVSPS